jgi:hypothetical protein
MVPSLILIIVMYGLANIPMSILFTMFIFNIFAGWLAGERHRFELPEGRAMPEFKEYGDVYGCGLVLDPEGKLSIFFTLNGQLMGELMLE